MNKDEMKMIEQIRKDFVARCLKGSDGCDLRDCQHCHAESLYNAGYRKVGKDEIVVKKSEYEKLRLAKYKAMEEAIEYEKTAYKQLEQAKQETREILQELYMCFTEEYLLGFRNSNKDHKSASLVKRLCKAHGIELERNL